MTLENLIDRFDRPDRSRRFDGGLDDLAGHRGDHNLNPDMIPQLGPDRRLTPAAVLVPIVNRPEGLTVILTQRTDHLSNHPGQISFPGGRTEKQDRGAVAAALRETEEEVGLSADRVRLLGRLDDYITRTGFVVTPVVGLVEPPFDLSVDPYEVAEVFEVPLAFLLDPRRHQRHSRQLEGRERFFYAMPYQGYFIWGATAGMLINLYEVLQPFNDAPGVLSPHPGE